MRDVVFVWYASDPLTGVVEQGGMTDDDLITDLKAQTRTHVHLAVTAESAPVAEMHIDLAQFSVERVRAYQELGEDQEVGLISWSKSRD